MPAQKHGHRLFRWMQWTVLCKQVMHLFCGLPNDSFAEKCCKSLLFRRKNRYRAALGFRDLCACLVCRQVRAQQLSWLRMRDTRTRRVGERTPIATKTPKTAIKEPYKTSIVLLVFPHRRDLLILCSAVSLIWIIAMLGDFVKCMVKDDYYKWGVDKLSNTQ